MKSKVKAVFDALAKQDVRSTDNIVSRAFFDAMNKARLKIDKEKLN